MFEGICDALSLETCDAATVAQTLGGFSGVLAAAFALIAVPLAWWQISAARRAQAQTTLYATAIEYFQLRQRHAEMWRPRDHEGPPSVEERGWLGHVPAFVVQQAHFIDVVLSCARLAPKERIKVLLPLMIRDFLIAASLDEISIRSTLANVAASNVIREENVFSYAGERLLELLDLTAPKWRRDFSGQRELVVEAIERAEKKYRDAPEP